jgi:DNA-binding LacI/PurR family transcriptional regulator/signal transduction histidine kinase
MQDGRTKRPRLGVVTAWLTDLYTREAVQGIAEVASEASAQVVCVTGERVEASRPLTGPRYVCYEQLAKHALDAVVVLTGTLAYDPSDLPPLFALLGGLPIVSAGMLIDGVASVGVDNEPGLFDLVTHLIDVHGLRTIAFIGGPEGHPEGEARERAYVRALRSRGIEPQDELITGGNFTAGTGERAVEELLGQRGAMPQAIVSCNDAMAYGALRALEACGLRVPDDVALTGFDDALESAGLRVPLSTVRQPVRELGRTAAHAAFDMLAGRVTPRRQLLHTTPVYRRSCGCLPAPRFVPPSSGSEIARPDDVRRALSGLDDLPASEIDELAHAFLSDLREPGKHRMYGLAEARLYESDDRARHVAGLDAFAVAMHDRVVPRLPAADRHVAESLLHALRDLPSRTAAMALVTERADGEVDLQNLIDGVVPLLTVGSDIPTMLEAFRARLFFLPIASCQIALFAATRDEAILVLDHRPPSESRVLSEGMRFASHAILPDGLLPDEPWLYVVSPLSDEDALGYAVFGADLERATMLWTLQWQITGGIRRILRRQELERAYDLLQQNTERLVVSEKLASLGRLTAGLAHEMNTPLAAVRASLRELENLANEYRSSIRDPAVAAEDHEAIAGDLAKTIREAEAASERLAQFIRSIRAQTRDEGPSQHSSFDAVEAAEHAILLLAHEARKANASIELFAPERPVPIHGIPARLVKLVEALLRNAIEATAPKGGGAVRVAVTGVEEIVVEVEDHGIGIAPEDLPRVFDPMFTTKPFGEAAGMGLTICHGIVTTDYGGDIAIESRTGEGTKVAARLRKRMPSLPPLSR